MCGKCYESNYAISNPEKTNLKNAKLIMKEIICKDMIGMTFEIIETPPDKMHDQSTTTWSIKLRLPDRV